MALLAQHKSLNKSTPQTVAPSVPKTISAQVAKVTSSYQKAESAASSKIPTLHAISKSGSSFAKKHPETAKTIYTAFEKAHAKTQKYGTPAQRQALAGYTYGSYQSLQKKPVKTSAMFAVGLAGGRALTAVSKVGKAMGAGTKAARMAKAAELGIVGIYGVQTTKHIMNAPNAYEAGQRAAYAMYTEILPMGFGAGAAGVKGLRSTTKNTIKSSAKSTQKGTTKFKKQTAKMLVDDMGSVGLNPTRSTATKTDFSKASFERVFKRAIRHAEQSAKRDLTATEKANIKASIKRSQQSEIEAINRSRLKAKARKEDTLAKKIAKQFEKERLSNTKKQTAKSSTGTTRTKTTASKETVPVTNITKRSQNLVEKAARLQDKYESGTISKSVYGRQKASIMKQAKEIDILRKNAIEVNKKAGNKPTAKKYQELEPTSKSVTSAMSKVKAAAREGLKPVAFVAAMNRVVTVAKTAEGTNIATKAKGEAATEARTNSKTVFPTTIKPKVPTPKTKSASAKAKRSTRAAPATKLPVPPIIPPEMGRDKKKKQRVKRVRKTTGLSTTQVKNSVATINSIFGGSK